MKQALYNCPACEKPCAIEELYEHALIQTLILGVDDSGDLVFDRPNADILNGQIKRYQCAECGTTVVDEDNAKIDSEWELVALLEKQIPWAVGSIEDQLEELEDQACKAQWQIDHCDDMHIKELYEHAIVGLADVHRSLTMKAQERCDEIDEMVMTEHDMEKATREAYQLEARKLEELARRTI